MQSFRVNCGKWSFLAAVKLLRAPSARPVKPESRSQTTESRSQTTETAELQALARLHPDGSSRWNNGQHVTQIGVKRFKQQEPRHVVWLTMLSLNVYRIPLGESQVGLYFPGGTGI